jgi:hypothetical protein
MRRMFFVLFLFSATPTFAQSHPDVVAQVKASLVARGIDLSGECGAFQITKRVAWQLRGEGAGLLDKPSGSNCQGFSTDIVAYPGGRIFDILIDGGGANGPAWNASDPVDPSRYRPAFDPGDAPGPGPVPVPTPAPVPTLDLTGVYQRIDWSDANNERRYLDLAAQVMAHDQKAGVLSETFGNRYVQIALAVLGTIITQQQVTK